MAETTPGRRLLTGRTQDATAKPPPEEQSDLKLSATSKGKKNTKTFYCVISTSPGKTSNEGKNKETRKGDNEGGENNKHSFIHL